MIKIYEKTGNLGLEITGTDSLEVVIKMARNAQGYMTLDRKLNPVFVPWHQIEFFRVEDNSAE